MLTPKMSPDCRASVVIPCLNEINLIESTVPTVAASLGAMTLEQSIEVVYVDGASTDGTKEYLLDVARKMPSIDVITEPVAGIGYARRTGARLALGRAAMRPRPASEDFWLISTDADVHVPPSWLEGWAHAFAATPHLALAGPARFPETLAIRYPNASQALDMVGENLDRLRGIFGAINLDGTNSAIERRAYAAIGIFDQPTIIEGGRRKNVAGEDWDMGTRTRILGLKVGTHSGEPVSISSRRFEHDREEFFSGAAYDKEFLRVDAPSTVPDMLESDIAAMTEVSVRRHCMHSACKPILVEPHILDQEGVRDFLGEDVVSAMKTWISKTPRPDMFTNRNGFILEYLVDFHRLFGGEISQRVLSLGEHNKQVSQIAAQVR